LKKITVIGMGLGVGTVTPEAQRAIGEAEVLLGAPRMLGMLADTLKPSYPAYLPADVAALAAKTDAENFAVLVSGDAGFYSAAAGLAEALTGFEISFIPGISTVNAFFAKLRLPWQDAAFVSVHGKKGNIADTVRRNRLTFCLTGGSAREIGAALKCAGFGAVKTYVGENLGTGAERVYESTAEQLGECPPLTVLLFENGMPDARVLTGIPDSFFARLAGVPMTKSETRAVVMSKLRLRPGDTCWDIGAGTGSVTVEMALSAYRGHVVAVERKPEAAPLIEQNCATFHLGNVRVVCGEAPAALEALPMPDAVFVGGSGGEMGGIIAAALCLNPNARLVVTAVTLETVSAALDAFGKAGLEPEIVQLGVARGKQVGAMHLMEAQNPVTILSASSLSFEKQRENAL
jgi:precorrin-6Y C5,15-methyltransferase (decarboxylating)